MVAVSLATADPPGSQKPPVNKGGMKVNSIDGKASAATDCVADHTCKKATPRGAAGSPTLPGTKRRLVADFNERNSDAHWSG